MSTTITKKLIHREIDWLKTDNPNPTDYENGQLFILDKFLRKFNTGSIQKVEIIIPSHTVDEIKQKNVSIANKAFRRFSDETKEKKSRIIRDVMKFLYKNHGVASIYAYDMDDFEDLFHYVEDKKATKDWKKKYRFVLKNIILKYYKNRMEFSEIGKWDYIFSDGFFQFTNTSKSQREIPIITPEQIRSFLSQIRMKSLRNYMFFAITAFSGCRSAGLRNLRVSDIDFSKGIIFTQEKPTRNSSGWNRYFLPEKFMRELKVYILRNNLQADDQICRVSGQQLRRIMKQIEPDWWMHLLRHTIRVNWLFKKMADVEAHFLLNHKPKNVDQQYLVALNNYTHLRKTYDQHFPYNSCFF